MLNRRSFGFIWLQAALFFSLISVAAAEEKVAGYVSGTQEVLQSIPLADGSEARRIMFSVSVITDDPNNSLHPASQDCFVPDVVSRNDKLLGGKGSCDCISADGHPWWITLELRPDGVARWANNGGVGKFKGFQSQQYYESAGGIPRWQDHRSF
jgi:hypothetical protein